MLENSDAELPNVHHVKKYRPRCLVATPLDSFVGSSATDQPLAMDNRRTTKQHTFAIFGRDDVREKLYSHSSKKSNMSVMSFFVRK